MTNDPGNSIPAQQRLLTKTADPSVPAPAQLQAQLPDGPVQADYITLNHAGDNLEGSRSGKTSTRFSAPGTVLYQPNSLERMFAAANDPVRPRLKNSLAAGNRSGYSQTDRSHTRKTNN